MVGRCQDSSVKGNPSGTAETRLDKYAKASAKHRYGEVPKRSTDTVKSPSEAQIR